ncbi:MAG: response regulator [Beijerinckiaceae bacterium]|nr:response regulator [Beijerinckiaceae bacterium]
MESIALTNLLEGMRILVLEDEFLIAMDVEQQCRDHGAADVRIARAVDEVDPSTIASEIDAAILDVMLGGSSTLDLADVIGQQGVPFVFASGYSDLGAISTRFPGVTVVGKPYAGDDLINALAKACGRL